uniref:Uncharacterized protein n=2 Tax=Oryza sativa subsp. japonica TaxID=39947 RepID=Q8LMD7_ORYSJ|nr:Unknown protein [Oryza sativa Japonica Group]AAP52222.1 hypothetical protein LOC_Os10g07100 [Oryza sativa Japonica Group]
MAKNYPFTDHEMALFPIEYQTMIEGISIDREVIHEDFHNVLDHVRENSHHTPLKRCRSVAQSEGYPTISIGTVWTCERSLTLVLWMDGNLMIPGIPIKEIEKRMICQPFQNFINEG